MNLFKLLTVLMIFSAPVINAENLKPATWVPLPAIGSSPETGFQYGVYVMRIFPQMSLEVPQSRLELLLQGTTNGQFQAYAWPNVYLYGDSWNFNGKIGGQYWPSEYFGQSNESPTEGDSYTNTAFESYVNINVKANSSTRLGISAIAELHNIDLMDDSDLITLLDANIPGNTGGFYSGTGLTATVDTRDNIDWPTHGHLIAAQLDIFSERLGSDESFSIFEIQSSKYFSFAKDILAINAQGTLTSQDTPFTHLPRPDGSSTLRGANGNRWIDNSAIGLQGEYRKPLSEKLSAVSFIDTFQVAPTFDAISLSDFHYSLGLGMRYAMTPDRFNIRFDIGWVDSESLNFTLSVGEAF